MTRHVQKAQGLSDDLTCPVAAHSAVKDYSHSNAYAQQCLQAAQCSSQAELQGHWAMSALCAAEGTEASWRMQHRSQTC